ncbi:MAG: FAD-binding oxidoreductase [Yoonia sp.]|jgi:glycine/D-amino acid oxidase-like deaminating enzyme|nr:FAD-binding oxidoreductase [Yoonia sp.]
MTKEKPISLWDATAEERDVHGVFTPDAHVDVAIVGGGFTGLSTALHCAEKGLSAHVLEAEHVGYGGSGRNVGLVNAALWLPPAKVREKLGKTYGPRFVERFGDGPRVVFDLIEQHQIRCEAIKTGTVHAAHAQSGFKDLQDRHAEWQRLGEPVDLIGRDEVENLIGSKAFYGGLLDHRAGTINPMGYCRGLARAALGAGADISTGVRVTKLDKDGDLWRVTTDQGQITAKNVVLGTNAYTDDLWPGLSNVFTMIHYLQFATTPMGPEAAHILPGKQGLWDTGQIMFNYRRDARDRLLIGTMGRIIGNKDRGLTRRWAQKQIARVFPELGQVDFEEAWHGQIAMTPDHLPRVHQLDTGLWTAIGYNGRGITTGTLFGQSMAALLTGMNPADLPLPVTDLATAPRSKFNAKIYDLAFTANQLWQGLR